MDPSPALAELVAGVHGWAKEETMPFNPALSLTSSTATTTFAPEGSGSGAGG